MMNEQEIISTLKRIGFEEDKIPEIMQDVGKVIYAKVLAAIINEMPEHDRARISSMQGEELQIYFADHQSALPHFSQADFDAIHDDTWKDYFETVGKDPGHIAPSS